MKSLLKRRRKTAQLQAIEPVASAFPVLRDAEIAAAFVGRRSAGDFYDSIRVGPSRILFGLLDVAGRRAQNNNILLPSECSARLERSFSCQRKSTKPTP
jgi:hypothetical protein